MPVQVVWDDEAHTILRQIYSGHVKLEDYMAAADELEIMAKTVPYTVHSIMDRTGVISAPSVIFPAMRYANSHVPPNLGVRVVVKGSAFTKVIVDIGRRVAAKLIQDIYFVSTLDEGREIISKHVEKVVADPKV